MSPNSVSSSMGLREDRGGVLVGVMTEGPLLYRVGGCEQDELGREYMGVGGSEGIIW